MIHPELSRLRQGVGTNPDDKTRYRYRVDALRAGHSVTCQPGDKVKLNEKDARVVAVRESLEGPEQLWIRVDGAAELHPHPPAGVKIVRPHRPAMLLGEKELQKRLESDMRAPDSARSQETLQELARRELKDSITVALSLLDQLEGAPSDNLHERLKALLRSRPSGEVDVALRKYDLSNERRPLVELPALAASVPDAQEASEVLDRLTELEPNVACQVIARCGRWLVGTGGPGFADPEVRDRVATLAREHDDHDVRVALFVAAARALQADDLLKSALESDNEDVQAGAAMELLRRGHAEPVWSYLAQEQRIPVLLELLGASKKTDAVAPLSLLQDWLAMTKDSSSPHAATLRDLALLRLAEVGDRESALHTLEPWLCGEQEEGLPAAVWSAGLLGGEGIDQRLLTLAKGCESLPRLGQILEALVRLGSEHASPALDAWGVPLAKGGLWGEELVDVCGFVLGRAVDPNELLSRFRLDPPQGPVRRARALDLAGALQERGHEAPALRLAREQLPCRLARFGELIKAAKGQ